MTDPGPRSVRRNICLYAALASPCEVVFFFSPPFLSFLLLGLSLLSTFLHLFSSYLFHPVTSADSPTAAPISPVEANYWSQVVEGLKRSFCLNFFFSFFSSPPPPPPISPKPERWMRTKSGSATEALSAVIKYGRKCC